VAAVDVGMSHALWNERWRRRKRTDEGWITRNVYFGYVMMRYHDHGLNEIGIEGMKRDYEIVDE